MNPATEIRPFRLFVAATLAAVLPMPSVFSVLVLDNMNTWAQRAFILALVTSWVLWLVGTAAFAASASEGKVRRLGCHLLGAALAFIHPLASAIVVQDLFPLLMPEASTRGTGNLPLLTYAIAGLLQSPFGWFGGWIVWRLGFPTAAAEYAYASRHSREWSSLRAARLLPALALVPLLPVLIVVLLLCGYTSEEFSDPWVAEIWMSLVAWGAAAGWTLAVVGGMPFLYAVSRGYRRVSRANCMTFGAVLAYLLPAAVMLIGFPLGEAVPSVYMLITNFLFYLPSDKVIGSMILVGTILLPLGLPGGWLLWRAGVAPASQPLPLMDPAAVFD